MPYKNQQTYNSYKVPTLLLHFHSYFLGQHGLVGSLQFLPPFVMEENICGKMAQDLYKLQQGSKCIHSKVYTGIAKSKLTIWKIAIAQWCPFHR